MKRLIKSICNREAAWLTAVFLCTLLPCRAAANPDLSETRLTGEDTVLRLVPEPVLLKMQKGSFQMLRGMTIHIASSGAKTTGMSLRKYIASVSPSGQPTLRENGVPRNGDILLSLFETPRPDIGDEGYVLEINKKQISIRANKTNGLFYGTQTLIQIIEDTRGKSASVLTLPALYIEDYPRFAYRGMLIDVAHHFLGKECVKSFIDQMAMFKFNKLQLHMTNDNGWRIEIKQYPKLTETGAWRVPRTGPWNTFAHLPPLPEEPCTDGGFFTQADIREIVSYASERYIEIIPGIELPGHMLALIAAYPEVSCTEKQYDVNPGIPRYWETKSPPDINYEMCAGKDSNFLMLENILDEYIQLFPGEYIHIGGDEAHKGFWEKCPKCQLRMKENNLKNVDELQSYFIKRIEKYLNSKGKKLLGWDEILEGGLAPNATVMSWRGMSGGLKAAKMGHDVIMAPNTFTYFDYRQNDPAALPHVTRWGHLPLSKVYAFEPVPKGLDSKHILGGQGCLWSEFIRTCDENAYQAWPRGMALSEVLWTPAAKRDVAVFLEKLSPRLAHLGNSGIRYSDAVYDPIITPRLLGDGGLEIGLSSEIENLEIHYTFNDHIPTKFADKYRDEPLRIPKGATRLMVASFRNGRQMGSILDISIKDLEERAKRSSR